MTRAVRELLATLAKLNQAVPQVALGIMDESLTPQQQIEFGGFLIEAGQLLQQHAHALDGDPAVDRTQFQQLCSGSG